MSGTGAQVPPTLTDRPRLRAMWGLVNVVEELMAAAATTTGDEATIATAKDLVEQAVAALGETADRIPRAGRVENLVERARTGVDLWIFPLNPAQIRLRTRIEGTRCHAEFTPRALQEGPPGCLHGGISASVLDTVLGHLVSAQGIIGFTHTLTVRYLSPTLLDIPILIGGEVTWTEGRKAKAVGWIEQDGRRTIEAEGLFVKPRDFELPMRD